MRPAELKQLGRDGVALDKFHAGRADPKEKLGSFIQRISPAFSDPVHLRPVVKALEQAARAARGEAEPVFICLSVPPQHGKTTTISHWLAKTLKRYPEVFAAYVSYNATIAEDKSRTIRDYARLAGIDLREDTDSVSLWRTPEGGGLAARGILGGAITGLSGLTILIVDDPHKNRAEAESRLIRDRVWNEFSSSIWTRLRKRTSVIIVHTRWHEDDLIGRIKKDPKLSKVFRVINLPAITEDGSALWPQEMPLELLALKRRDEYEWWSLYMGEPRPREGKVFAGVTYYDQRPNTLRVAIGTDLAYSAKTSSDWNVAVVLGEHSVCIDEKNIDRKFYLLEVARRQCDAPTWEGELKKLRTRYPRAPMRAYLSGTEKGSADFMIRGGLKLDIRNATSDKLVRATPASIAWKHGEILVPRDQAMREGSTVTAFLDVVCDFTGVGDAHDDDVDALAAAYDQLAAGPATLSSTRTGTGPEAARVLGESPRARNLG
jgi:hypothetical protein